MLMWRSRPSASPASIVNPQNFLNLLVDPADSKVDIFAVHGLNPLNNETHAESTWTAEGRLWLRDFLPKRAPKARIFLYGYNANVAFSAASAGVREQAECLLDQISKKRAECPNRPIIFIAHSLGGIIVKRALVHAKSDNTYENIWSSTFGIAFFGTPHRGGNRAGLGDRVATVIRAVTGNPENTYMKALKRDSQFSKILADDFRQLHEELQMVSFYETRPLGRFGIVVDKDSATLGLAGTREKQIATDADHRTICKFASEEDSRYQQVADNIVTLINSALSSPKITKRGTEQYDGNISSIKGMRNNTNQGGRGNWSSAVGMGNETNQFGRQNRSETDGEDNVTTQIEMWEEDALKFAERFLLGRAR